MKQQLEQNRNNIGSFNLLGGFILEAVVQTGHQHQGLGRIRDLT